MVHQATNVIHRELRVVRQLFFTPFRQWTTLKKANGAPAHHQARGEGDLEVICEVFHQGNLRGRRSR